VTDTLEITTTVWVGTLLFIAALFAFDLTYSSRRPHAVGFKEAVVWSVIYIGIAIAFGLWFWWWAGSEFGAEYFSGYIVEKSLSVDNLFVFVIIMTTFAVPKIYQQRLLTIGILLALVFRAIFIALGAALLAYFSFMFLIFGAVLIWTGVKLYQHRDEDPEINDNAIVRVTRKIIPVTDEYHEGKYFVRLDGRRVATPLFMAFIAIGSTDILFALDSIPAVYGVTSTPYIVFVANAFALLGLRALYFLVVGLLDRLVYLSTGLAVILVFIGIKLVLHWAHGIWSGVPEIPTTTSLFVIIGILVVTTIASIVAVRKDPSRVAHAGSIREHEQQDDH
jgi:tellurite resistance protein TerC